MTSTKCGRHSDTRGSASTAVLRHPGRARVCPPAPRPRADARAQGRCSNSDARHHGLRPRHRAIAPLRLRCVRGGQRMEPRFPAIDAEFREVLTAPIADLCGGRWPILLEDRRWIFRSRAASSRPRCWDCCRTATRQCGCRRSFTPPSWETQGHSSDRYFSIAVRSMPVSASACTSGDVQRRRAAHESRQCCHDGSRDLAWRLPRGTARGRLQRMGPWRGVQGFRRAGAFGRADLARVRHARPEYERALGKRGGAASHPRHARGDSQSLARVQSVQERGSAFIAAFISRGSAEGVDFSCKDRVQLPPFAVPAP